MADGKTQIKFDIESGTVAAFKARCAGEGVSMTSAVRRFMAGCGADAAVVVKTHTRPLRRKAAVLVTRILEDILLGEEEYRDAIPEQFEQRRETADQACECLAEAIGYLEGAFR